MQVLFRAKNQKTIKLNSFFIDLAYILNIFVNTFERFKNDTLFIIFSVD